MTHFTDAPRLPVIDLSLFEVGNPWRDHVAAQIDWAAAEFGIFRVVNHGVEPSLIDSLMSLSRRYFARQIAAEHRLRASIADLADCREELRFDADFTRDDAQAPSRLAAPDRELFFELPGFRDAVRDYMATVTGLSNRLMTSFARGLHLGDNYFIDRHTGGAKAEFRIVSSKPAAQALAAAGKPDARASFETPVAPSLLTIVNHDAHAGLEVKYGKHTIEVPSSPGALVVAIGKPLARLTEGRYAAARYRLTGSAGNEALAMPFYFGSGIQVAARARLVHHPAQRSVEHGERRFRGAGEDGLSHGQAAPAGWESAADLQPHL